MNSNPKVVTSVGYTTADGKQYVLNKGVIITVEEMQVNAEGRRGVPTAVAPCNMTHKDMINATATLVKVIADATEVPIDTVLEVIRVYTSHGVQEV